jgi:fumarate reductase flavoprotein subunit
MEEKKNFEIDRRLFVKGAALVGGAAALTGLVACGQEAPAKTEGGGEPGTEPVKVAETYDCDILIAGCGISGLECAAAASLNGAKVIGIEKRDYLGGNGQFTEGLFAVNSPIQKELGITFDKKVLMRKELPDSQYAADGSLWDKFLDRTGEDIGWLMEHGVSFGTEDIPEGVTDAGGLTPIPCVHLFKDRSASSELIPSMTKIAEENGAEFFTQTPFTALITDAAGKVIGAYATNASGETLQFNAKKVILATGSFAGDEELMNLCGFNVEGLDIANSELSQFSTGDGIKAAVKACNAKTLVEHAGWNSFNIIGSIDNWNMFSVWSVSNPSECMLVNQDGARFIPEDFAVGNSQRAAIPGLTQKQIYSVFDRASVERWVDYPLILQPPMYTPFTLAELDAINDPALCVGDTLEDAGQKAGIDLDLLKKAVDRYNELVAQGEDEDYGKASDKLYPISTPPYYVAKISVRPYVMIGGLYTDRDMRVLDARKNVIEGLYAIGVDGCMLYRTIYSYDYALASANAHNIFSARVAAEHATKNL